MTNTPHFTGMIRIMTMPMSRSIPGDILRQWIGCEMHAEGAQGCADEYGIFKSGGEKPQQGAKVDIEAALDALHRQAQQAANYYFSVVPAKGHFFFLPGFFKLTRGTVHKSLILPIHLDWDMDTRV